MYQKCAVSPGWAGLDRGSSCEHRARAGMEELDMCERGIVPDVRRYRHETMSTRVCLMQSERALVVWSGAHTCMLAH